MKHVGSPVASPCPSPAARTSAGISLALLTPCRRPGLARTRRAAPSPLTPRTPIAPAPTHNPRKLLPAVETDLQTEESNLQPEGVLDYIELTASLDNQLVVQEIQKEEAYVPKITAEDDRSKNDEVTAVEISKDAPICKKSKSTPKILRREKSINLTRKCMVIINKDVLKLEEQPKIIEKINLTASDDNMSTKLQDPSDADDVPLIDLPKKNADTNVAAKKRPRTLILEEEDSDFCNVEKLSNKIKKVEPSNKLATVMIKVSNNHKPPSTKEIKTKPLLSKNNTPHAKVNICTSIAMNSSDVEDDDFDSRKTILIRKTYNKVDMKKAKSTGSITQKDIDDIKSRIKMKQNALLAKSGHNILELTELIKKWRKGCQEALMELLELMKRRFPDKENMNTLELLKMLNIPPALVDYNSDDDAFISPE